jgi:hypothetical protein
MREQLVVELQSDQDVDGDPAGPISDGETIYIDAHDWSNRVTEVALAAQGAHDHFQRVEAVRTFEPPSIEWETTLGRSDAELPSDGAVSDVAEGEVGE